MSSLAPLLGPLLGVACLGYMRLRQQAASAETCTRQTLKLVMRLLAEPVPVDDTGSCSADGCFLFGQLDWWPAYALLATACALIVPVH